MKWYTVKSVTFATLSLIVATFWSCTKEKVSPPASQQSTSASEDALLPGENITDTVVTGTYVITKFIDSSVDNTAEFNGYTFEFQSDHDLVAHDGGTTFNGRWRTNGAQTSMAINISGTPALDDLDGNDWTITKSTDQRLIIKRRGPDKVVFRIQ